jgi:tetratricopeptide (TPR) repeat protein
MKTNRKKFWIIILIFINLSCGTPALVRYQDALRDARSGNIDFAFLKLKNYLLEYPDSSHTKEIKFAIGEYYLQVQDFRDAIYKLSDYIKDYTGDGSIIFAQALLYKALLEYKKEPQLIEKIKESFFSKSLFLFFSKSKTKYHKSILNNTYKILNYLDKIEILRNNEIILKITP